MDNFNKSLFDKVSWNKTGQEIEKMSFNTIENECRSKENFSDEEWKIARRLIHTTADFSIINDLKFKNNPIQVGLDALRKGAVIYSDSNMIKSGLSVPKLKKYNPNYERESIQCYIANSVVANLAKENNTTRALASVEKAIPVLNDAIILIGNAPLALAKMIKLIVENKIKPALIIGMPVGFVNVVESKELLIESNIPYITIAGRRGGSPLAVATLHAIMENG